MDMSDRGTGGVSIIRRAFPSLEDGTAALMERVAVARTHPAGAVLCLEGEAADAFYVVADGRVVISRRVEGADEGFVVGTLEAGGCFGEMALLTGDPRAATVTAAVATSVLEIRRQDFDALFAASPSLARSILETLIGAVRETDRRAIEDLGTRNAELRAAYAALEAAQADRIAKAALEAQLAVAAEAQRSLLPDSLPVVPRFEFGARFEPARQVGGDFYDARLRDDGKISLLVADVSDKGAHAAIFMAVARTLFLVEQRHGADPVGVAHAIHDGLIGISVTALLGTLDPETGLLRYVRCGHDEPVLIRKDGAVSSLGGAGRFLGMLNDPPPHIEEQEVRLGSGDVLLLFSDGVTDMRDPGGACYGRDALVEVARRHRTLDAESIAGAIHGAVCRHRAGAEAFDDFTLLVVRGR
jgi:phosphoserine phosphatase RsbU/P